MGADYRADLLESQSDICHYGVKGMRWGVRRYQNADGSLTSAGKKKYNKLSSDHDKVRSKEWKQIAKVATNKHKRGTGKLKRLATKSAKTDIKLNAFKQQFTNDKSDFGAKANRMHTTMTGMKIAGLAGGAVGRTLYSSVKYNNVKEYSDFIRMYQNQDMTMVLRMHT